MIINEKLSVMDFLEPKIEITAWLIHPSLTLPTCFLAESRESPGLLIAFLLLSFIFSPFSLIPSLFLHHSSFHTLYSHIHGLFTSFQFPLPPIRLISLSPFATLREKLRNRKSATKQCSSTPIGNPDESPALTGPIPSCWFIKTFLQNGLLSELPESTAQ